MFLAFSDSDFAEGERVVPWNQIFVENAIIEICTKLWKEDGRTSQKGLLGKVLKVQKFQGVACSGEGSRHQTGKAERGFTLQNLPHILMIWDFIIYFIWELQKDFKERMKRIKFAFGRILESRKHVMLSSS